MLPCLVTVARQCVSFDGPEHSSCFGVTDRLPITNHMIVWWPRSSERGFGPGHKSKSFKTFFGTKPEHAVTRYRDSAPSCRGYLSRTRSSEVSDAHWQQLVRGALRLAAACSRFTSKLISLSFSSSSFATKSLKFCHQVLQVLPRWRSLRLGLQQPQANWQALVSDLVRGHCITDTPARRRPNQ